MQDKAKTLGIPNKIAEPMKDLPELSKIITHAGTILFGLWALCGLFALILYPFVGNVRLEVWLLGIFSFVGCAGLAVFFECGLCGRMKEIEESQNKYYQDTKADQLRVESELQQQAVLLFQAKKIKEQISQSRQTLRQIYEYNVIAPKYHEYTAVCSLYEYLSLGLCSELKGPYGAYKILEDYKRLDKIILGINHIVYQLEQIKSNQYRIYQSVQQANQQLTSLVASTERVADSVGKLQSSVDKQGKKTQKQLEELYISSELGNYHSERIQKELHYMNRMKYLCSEYDEAFDNLPPN